MTRIPEGGYHLITPPDHDGPRCSECGEELEEHHTVWRDGIGVCAWCIELEDVTDAIATALPKKEAAELAELICTQLIDRSLEI